MSLEDLSPRQFMALTQAHLRRHVLEHSLVASSPLLGRRTMLGGAIAAAAATAGPAWAAPTRGGTLRIGRVEEPDTLDPHKTSLSIAQSTMLMVLEPLARRDGDGKVMPGFAEGWEFRDQNRTIVFHLRQGVTFHDGSSCDAAACAYTVQRHVDAATASPTAFMLGPIDKAEVIDAHTVAYHFRQPFVPVWVGLTLSYCAILPPGPAAKPQFGRNPVGAGPFRFTSWSPDGGIKLARFDGYKCGPVPLLDALQLTQYPEDATRVAALQSGEIQAMQSGQSVPLDRVRSLSSDSEIKLLKRVSQSTRALCFNQSLAPMNDLKVRQAICHAVDPKRVIALALDGNAGVAYGPMPSAIPGYDKKVESIAYNYDPARAKTLLAEAGVAAGLELRLICNNSPSIRRSAEIVQAQLREIGISLSVQSMPIGQVVVQTKKAEHHIYLYTYAYPDPDVLYPVFHSAGSLNRNFAANPELDRILEASRTEFDDAKRQALYDAAQEMLVRQAYWAPLFEPLNFAAFADSVKGAVLRSDGDVDLTVVSLNG